MDLDRLSALTCRLRAIRDEVETIAAPPAGRQPDVILAGVQVMLARAVSELAFVSGSADAGRTLVIR